MEIIWIISEGSPGHLAQSHGLADALKSYEPSMKIAEVDIGRRFSGVQRSLIRWLMGPRGKRAPSFLRGMVLKDVHLPKGRPDLIISSGGKSVLHWRGCWPISSTCPTFFIGERKPYRSEWFHTVFTPSPIEQGIHDVAIDLIPTWGDCRKGHPSRCLVCAPRRQALGDGHWRCLSQPPVFRARTGGN